MARQVSTALPSMGSAGFNPTPSKISIGRLKAARLPYSCQAQRSTLALGSPQAGGVLTVRGRGCGGCHSTMFTITRAATR